MANANAKANAELTVDDIDIQSTDDLEDVIDRIGTLESEIDQKNAERKHEERKLKKRFGRMIDPRAKKLAVLTKAATAYAREHRDTLLDGTDGKTVDLLTGSVSFKKGRTRLVYTDDKEAIIERLREIGEDELVVEKETLHKKPLMKAWERIQGVKGLEMEEAEEQVKIKPLAA